MKTDATIPSMAVLSIALSLGGCAGSGRSIDHVQAGMNREQVQSIMGRPETTAHSPGKECAYYTRLKDFWSRVPWSVSERYYVCFDEGRVESFGKVDNPGS